MARAGQPHPPLCRPQGRGRHHRPWQGGLREPPGASEGEQLGKGHARDARGAALGAPSGRSVHRGCGREGLAHPLRRAGRQVGRLLAAGLPYGLVQQRHLRQREQDQHGGQAGGAQGRRPHQPGPQRDAAGRTVLHLPPGRPPAGRGGQPEGWFLRLPGRLPLPAADLAAVPDALGRLPDQQDLDQPLQHQGVDDARRPPVPDLPLGPRQMRRPRALRPQLLCNLPQPALRQPPAVRAAADVPVEMRRAGVHCGQQSSPRPPREPGAPLHARHGHEQQPRGERGRRPRRHVGHIVARVPRHQGPSSAAYGGGRDGHEHPLPPLRPHAPAGGREPQGEAGAGEPRPAQLRGAGPRQAHGRARGARPPLVVGRQHPRGGGAGERDRGDDPDDPAAPRPGGHPVQRLPRPHEPRAGRGRGLPGEPVAGRKGGRRRDDHPGHGQLCRPANGAAQRAPLPHPHGAREPHDAGTYCRLGSPPNMQSDAKPPKRG
mmetsp:Transcript_3333/g.7852  ORF Transcript_3333/g.7852 Transcript_3333/m.7852 type:complete len:488 (-) Transcript_3333:789-2252(-)